MAWQASKERRPMRLGHLVWGLLCLFLMAWGFALGLWVGQGSLATPEQVAGLRQWASFLPGLGQPAPESPEAQAEKQAAPPPTPPQLSFYTNLEKGEAPPPAQMAAKPAEPPAPQPAKPPETPAAPPAKPPVYGEIRPFAPSGAPPATPAAKPPATATPPVKPAAPVAAPPPPKPAAPPATQARQGRFTVQVASFKDEGQARELLAQLRGGGHPAYMVPVRLEGVGVRYRVRVGPFYDLDVAQGAAGRIRLQLTLAAYVTRED